MNNNLQINNPEAEDGYHVCPSTNMKYNDTTQENEKFKGHVA